MVEQWKMVSGQSQEECAHAYLKAAQEWRFYGAALFEAEVSHNHSYWTQHSYYVYHKSRREGDRVVLYMCTVFAI